MPPIENKANSNFLPYVDVTMLETSQENLSSFIKYGVKSTICAFMQQDTTSLVPKALWAGNIKENTPNYLYIKNAILDYDKSGYYAEISLGGANGTPIWMAQNANANNVEEELANIVDTYYQKAPRKTIDFDIEGNAVANHKATQLLGEACKLLNAIPNYSGVNFTLTLPVLLDGLTADGKNTVQAFRKGYESDFAVNVMAMDYGDNAAPNPDGKMGQYAISAAESTAEFVAPLFSISVDDFTKKFLGITPMIGLNDVITETFTYENIKEVADHYGGSTSRLHQISMWCINRDNPGSGGTTSSGYLEQKEKGEFSQLFAGYFDPTVTGDMSGVVNSSVYAVSKEELEIGFTTSKLQNVLYFSVDINGKEISNSDNINTFVKGDTTILIINTSNYGKSGNVKLVPKNLNVKAKNIVTSSILSYDGTKNNYFDLIITKFVEGQTYIPSGSSVYNPQLLIAYNNQVYKVNWWYNSSNDGAPNNSGGACTLYTGRDPNNPTFSGKVSDLINFGYTKSGIDFLTS